MLVQLSQLITGCVSPTLTTRAGTTLAFIARACQTTRRTCSAVTTTTPLSNTAAMRPSSRRSCSSTSPHPQMDTLTSEFKHLIENVTTHQNTTALQHQLLWKLSYQYPHLEIRRDQLVIVHLLTIFDFLWWYHTYWHCLRVCWRRSTPTEAFTTATGKTRCSKAAKWCSPINVTISMKNILGILTQMCCFMRSELGFSAKSSMNGCKERAHCATEALCRRLSVLMPPPSVLLSPGLYNCSAAGHDTSF